METDTVRSNQVWTDIHRGYLDVPERSQRAAAIRYDFAECIRKIGWSRLNDWQWIKDEVRWNLELSVVCATPHSPIIDATRLDHPIMMDHGKVQRGMQWAKKAAGHLRTYTFALAYDTDSAFSATNGLYVVSHPTLMKLYSPEKRIHVCRDACREGNGDRIWHFNASHLVPIMTWGQLQWR